MKAKTYIIKNKVYSNSLIVKPLAYGQRWDTTKLTIEISREKATNLIKWQNILKITGHN